jgi:hypothetical protein
MTVPRRRTTFTAAKAEKRNCGGFTRRSKSLFTILAMPTAQEEEESAYPDYHCGGGLRNKNNSGIFANIKIIIN